MKIDLRIGTIADVLTVDSQIPEFDGRTTADKLTLRLAGKANLILVAYVQEQPVGYKIGYEISGIEFYSWLGGVVPLYRKQGIATKLREKQESWAAESGFDAISVKSMNQYPAMLQLLIASGYQISGYEDNGSLASNKIKFIKYIRV